MTDFSADSILRLLEYCLNERQPILDSMHHEALRLFNGFLEGCPVLQVDVFASTLLVYNYAENPGALDPLLSAIRHFYRERLPWIRCTITKTRQSKHIAQRQGESDGGGQPDHRMSENNTWYAIDLTMNQDASFYLDTRNLRQWLRENARGWHVLNTFAYTGSLGIAALAGGASHVIQTDRSRKFLELAEESYEVNGFASSAHEHIIGDFFPVVGRMRHSRILFDCVIVDPPFFSATEKGKV
ncbi:SAM-dependent methyltransferase, partial [bacterium]|nr:SAM-dependent methyltransferase [bacterium]